MVKCNWGEYLYMKKCYICRETIKEYHECYNDICKKCGDFNIYMRNLNENLDGYIAIVTGGRIKIGYYTSLRLLRAGAKVIVTTRFPFDALERYNSEDDYDVWKNNLIICEVDLKKVGAVESFINYVKSKVTHIDIIINNAAQTIKKSKSYYEKLNESEERLKVKYLSEDKFYENLGGFIFNKNLLMKKQDELINLEENIDYNSWVSKPEDISLYEFLEVQVINVTSPFMICTRLKDMMIKSNNKNKFIINVSSLEGMFNEKRKSSKHIHTNMAKASLNMMTKSLAKDYAKNRIFVFSVDPGWVSNQFPEKWNGRCNEDFKAPLTYEDAAARICNPIYKYINSDKLDEFGVLLKDYKRVDW